MSDIAELKKQLSEIKAKLDAFEQTIKADFDVETIDGVEYYDSKNTMRHQQALDLAEKHGLRVMESWEMNKLFIENEAFRHSLKDTWYWCASVDSNSRNNAWQFFGSNGDVFYHDRSGNSAVRAVKE